MTTASFFVEEHSLEDVTTLGTITGHVNCLIIFDSQNLIKDLPKGTETNPTFIDYEKSKKYIYMMVQSEKGVTPGPALTINAVQGETIRWRETTLTRGAEHFAVLYEYKFHSGNKDVLGTPKAIVLKNIKVPLPDPTTGKIGTQIINDYFWNAIAEQQGSVNYYFRFKILDRKGNALGYYYWDPAVVVKE